MKRIVVGVDGSANSTAALAWAVDEAKVHGAKLDALLVWHQPVYGGMYGVAIPPIGVEVEEAQRNHLADLVDSCDADGLTEPIGQMIREGSAAGTLLDESATADLVVLGSRGHGGFVGLLLGSVSNQVVAHASCPVVVVPAPDGNDDG